MHSLRTSTYNHSISDWRVSTATDFITMTPAAYTTTDLIVSLDLESFTLLRELVQWPFNAKVQLRTLSSFSRGHADNHCCCYCTEQLERQETVSYILLTNNTDLIVKEHKMWY
jgi:hypothetical protein